jgi:Transposase DDE domain
LFERMHHYKVVCLRRLGGNRATEVKFGRWLRNKKVKVNELIEQSVQKTAALAEGLHVLAIQDTTELNYQAHADRTHGLGTVGNGTDKGLFMHPMLTLNADTGACLGLSGMKVWARQREEGRKYWQLPIEEKETYRWLEVAEQAKENLNKAAQITIIADRESDIYEEWARIPDAKTHVLTRVCRDRALSEAGSLYAAIDQMPVQEVYSVEVPARPKKRSAHEAKLALRFGRVSIKRPSKCKNADLPKALDLTIIDVRELSESVVGNEEPIHWRLFTTHQVEQAWQARQVVDWYRQRWLIEQLFRTVKKQGLNLESSQLEQGESLMKLAVLAVQVAVTGLQLVLSREGQTEQPISEVFTQHEMLLLSVLLCQYEGRTQKQKNPYNNNQLAWASWIIARIGGWKGYGSESPPGPITMLRGLRDFAMLYKGWSLQNEMCA